MKKETKQIMGDIVVLSLGVASAVVAYKYLPWLSVKILQLTGNF